MLGNERLENGYRDGEVFVVEGGAPVLVPQRREPAFTVQIKIAWRWYGVFDECVEDALDRSGQR